MQPQHAALLRNIIRSLRIYRYIALIARVKFTTPNHTAKSIWSSSERVYDRLLPQTIMDYDDLVVMFGDFS